jgi:hypothetical protein
VSCVCHSFLVHEPTAVCKLSKGRLPDNTPDPIPLMTKPISWFLWAALKGFPCACIIKPTRTQHKITIHQVSQNSRHVSVGLHTIFRGIYRTLKTFKITLAGCSVILSVLSFFMFPWRWCKFTPKHVGSSVRLAVQCFRVVCELALIIYVKTYVHGMGNFKRHWNRRCTLENEFVFASCVLLCWSHFWICAFGRRKGTFLRWLKEIVQSLSVDQYT